MAAVILEPKKIKSVTVCTVYKAESRKKLGETWFGILPVMGPWAMFSLCWVPVSSYIK